VDFNRNVIIVEKTKGKKVREIPMTRRVRAIFQELRPTMFRQLSGVTASHKFRAVANAIGLPPSIKLHSLRHTFATMLVAHGYDIKVVKELLGHEDIRITEIYAKVGGEIKQQAINSLEKFQERGYDLVTLTESPMLGNGKTP
jgi:integrase/recombinase XerD